MERLNALLVKEILGPYNFERNSIMSECIPGGETATGSPIGIL